ncbi:PqqD family protein [Fictibacillus sp. Mic-4]|uniref:PqqD family protein n=1 Tax=Fictibacillus sp. Mic-4 TaxID=3132826 RepID=UPI003CF7A6D7
MGLLFHLKKEKRNLLLMVPRIKEKYRLERLDNGTVFLVIPRTNPIERFSVRFLKQPQERKVKLDQLGSFVISHINGKRPVNELAALVEERFGKSAAPVLPRLVKFMQIIEANGWIEWK